MNDILPIELLNAEKNLMDRFGNYLIVAMDGDKIYRRYNSSISAMGMIKFVEAEIQKGWNTDEPEDD